MTYDRNAFTSVAREDVSPRRVLLYGAATSVTLALLAPLAIVTLPLAVAVLATTVIYTAVGARNRAALFTGFAAAVVLLASAIVWWVAWGQAFDYADAGAAVPATTQTAEAVSAIGALTAAAALCGLWLWLLTSLPITSKLSTE